MRGSINLRSRRPGVWGESYQRSALGYDGVGDFDGQFADNRLSLFARENKSGAHTFRFALFSLLGGKELG